MKYLRQVIYGEKRRKEIQELGACIGSVLGRVGLAESHHGEWQRWEQAPE
jgi:hypothetical protein